MTFMHNGHQYIVVATASATVPGELCIALPDAKLPHVNLGY
jgi:hypothetical protein